MKVQSTRIKCIGVGGFIWMQTLTLKVLISTVYYISYKLYKKRKLTVLDKTLLGTTRILIVLTPLKLDNRGELI